MTFLQKIAKSFTPGKRNGSFQPKLRVHWLLSCRNSPGFLLRYYDPTKKRYVIREVNDHSFELDQIHEMDECPKAAHFKCFPVNVPSRFTGGFWFTLTNNGREITHQYFEFINGTWLKVDLEASVRAMLNTGNLASEVA